MTRHFFPAAVLSFHGAVASAAAALVLLTAPAGAGAQDKAREACALHAASGDVASDTPGGMAADVTAARPVGLANWDVRWWQRHRLWITIAATNRGDGATSVLPEIVVDLKRDGSMGRGLPGLPLALAPHAGASARMAFYVPDDARTVGLRVHAATTTTDVGVTLDVECSTSRFDVGEMAKPAAALLDEALTRYLADYMDPLPGLPTQALETVRVLASGAQDAGDVAWAMRGLMASVGDAASTMSPPGEAAPAEPALVTRAPTVEWRPDGTAVMRLFAVDFHSDAERLAWSRDLQERIAAVAAKHPRAWIVDLREHAGRDPWGTLAALSSLLDGPSVGAFVTREGRQEWIVERGAARIAGAPASVDLQLAPEPPFTGPIAVLLGAHTTNVGEVVAVAFEGRPHTRTFGAPTRGFPELGVHVHLLSDGSAIGVLDTRVADRTGLVHRGPIVPDERSDASVHTDAVPQEAVDWVQDEHVGMTSNR